MIYFFAILPTFLIDLVPLKICSEHRTTSPASSYLRTCKYLKAKLPVQHDLTEVSVLVESQQSWPVQRLAAWLEQ